MGSGVFNLLQRERKKARLRFWRMLLLMTPYPKIDSPFAAEPPGAVYMGPMPRYMRSAFMRAYLLRSAERKSEAEIFEEALSELLEMHFRHVVLSRAARGEKPVGHFLLGKDWKVYAMPL